MGQMTPDGRDFEKLLDWTERRLDDEEAARLARWERVATPDELGELAWIRSFVKASEEIVLESPPHGLRADLENLFDGYAEGRERPGILRRFVASLTFDSASQASYGVRSAGDPSGEGQRQLSFEVETADLSVSIQPRGDGGMDLLAQILPTGDEDPEAFTVQLTKSGEEVAITNADDLGEFVFEGVPSGTYELILTDGATEIATPSFDLNP